MKDQEHLSGRPAWVIGPRGEALAREDLPKSGERWTPYRKAVIVAALGGGLISIAEIHERYGIGIEELASWQRGFDRYGMASLRQTKIQLYRDKMRQAAGIS